MAGLIPYLLAQNTSFEIFQPKFAPLLISVANMYFQEPLRLILDLTANSFPLFMSKIEQGHNAPIVVLAPPSVPFQLVEQVQERKSDMIIVLGNTSLIPNRAEWRTWRWNPEGRVLLVTTGGHARAQGVARALYRLTKTKNLVTALLEDGAINFYSWLPYLPGECSQVLTTSLINRWHWKTDISEGFETDSPLYVHDKISNMNNCPVLATSTTSQPYVIANFSDGIEIRVIEILQKFFNFSLNYVMVPAGENFWLPQVWNGSQHEFRGAFRLLYEQEVDIAFAGITATVDRFAASIPLSPHAMERIIWVVPSPEMLSPVETIFHVFSLYVWLAILSSFMALCFLVFVTQSRVTGRATLPRHAAIFQMKNGRLLRNRGTAAPRRRITFGESCMYTYEVLVTGMPPFITKDPVFRHITFLILLLSIHFFIAFQSSLINLLTTPLIGGAFLTLEQLVQQQLACFSYGAGIRLLQDSAGDGYLTPNCSAITSLDPTLDEIVTTRHAFLLYLETPIYYSTWQRYNDGHGRDLLSSLPDPFMVLQVSFFMSPGNPLARVFETKVQQLVEGGVVGYWEKRVRTMNILTHRDDVTTQDVALKPLSAAHLQGVFVSFSLALCFALAVFLAEIFLWCMKRHTYTQTNAKKQTQ